MSKLNPVALRHLTVMRERAEKHVALYEASMHAIIMQEFGRKIDLKDVSVDWQTGELKAQEDENR